MSFVCLPNCGFLSETSRMVAIFRSLEQLGLPARLATHGGRFESVLQDEGIPYDRLEPFHTLEDERRFLELTTKPWVAAYQPGALAEHVRSEIEYFREHAARAAIIGFNLPTALSARAAGIPLIVTHAGSFVPPILERGLFACAEYFDGAPLGLLPRGWRDRFGQWLFPRARWQTRLFNRVAAEMGIEGMRSTWELLLGDLTLVTDVPEILGITAEDLEAWRPADTAVLRPTLRFRYAGAIYARLFGGVPEDVADFLSADKPKVYVSLSSSRPEFLDHVHTALAGMDVQVVSTSTVHADGFRCATNILVKDFLPSHKVMPLCDLTIIHGGQGSVQTAISAGTPLIGFPLQPEQNFNLRQIERHGAGRCLSLRRLKRGGLRRAVEEVIGDGGHRSAMSRLQAWQAARDGPLEAAKAVRSLLNERDLSQRDC